jgi:hypothetical protein
VTGLTVQVAQSDRIDSAGGTKSDRIGSVSGTE